MSQLPACTDDIYEIKFDMELNFASLESFFVDLLQTLSVFVKNYSDFVKIISDRFNDAK